MLQMANEKTEFTYFGSKQMLSLCNVEEIDIQETTISRSKIVRYLAALLDSEQSFKKYDTTICANAVNIISLNRIKQIRNSLSKDVCQTLVQALVISHLDYANAILIDFLDIAIKNYKEYKTSLLIWSYVMKTVRKVLRKTFKITLAAT